MQLRSDIFFPPKDEDLRRDVGDLGRLVGDVVKEQASRELFDLVEGVRHAAILRREGRQGADLEALTTGLPPEKAAALTRAFSLYFQVVNLAEAVHRIRRSRSYLMPGDGKNPGLQETEQAPTQSPPQPDSIEDAMERLAAEGIDCGSITRLLDRILIEPVFTAHPTEATRRTILEKQRRIAFRLTERLQDLTIPESRACWERIRAEVTSIWQTEEHPSQRPSVRDEREGVLFYLTDVIYAIVPPFFEALERALERSLGIDCSSNSLPSVLSFASWVGGDMDGNPNVTAETIQESLSEHRALLLPLYSKELRSLSRRLSQTVPQRAQASEAVFERLESYKRLFREEAGAIPPRHSHMPYRNLLRLMDVRLQATLQDKTQGYRTPEELESDLQVIADSLRKNKGEKAGRFAVVRTLRRVRTFGFHLAVLDVRQDSRQLREALAQLLGDAQWPSRTSEERVQRLDALLEGEEDPPRAPDGVGRQAIDVFRTMLDCRTRFGRRAVGPFIISMTQGADDVLTVLLLSRWSGFAERDGLDIAPLFETVPDLKAAPEIMRRLLGIPVYRRHLEDRRQRQMVMVGYSDSNKEGGLASSRWALQRAQRALAEALNQEGIRLTVFHGRGGTVSRGGGGKTHRAVLAAPASAVDGRLRMTEQGETIDAKYGLRPIALRTLERSFSAVIRSSAKGPRPRREEFEAAMEELAVLGRRTYRALVYETPEFLSYFRSATPIDVIERMAIGSRPASRRARHGIEDLRAIPWVFSWTQSRHLLPGWYGLGTALEDAAEAHGIDFLQRMLQEWDFFRLMMDDVETMLAVADMFIASCYADLAEEGARPVFERIRDEFERTDHWVLRIKDQLRPLEGVPTLRRAIGLRNPYVDPMSFLQIDLLARWRSGGRTDEALFRALQNTVNGIARGLQSTG